MENTYQQVTVEAMVQAPLDNVWDGWTDPEQVKEWNAASDDWYTPTATNDLRVGGVFHYQMAARDKSVEFDFSGTYTEIVPQQKICYVLGDGRTVKVTFEETGAGVNVKEVFDIEDINSADMQRTGWQAILDRFKRHVESGR